MPTGKIITLVHLSQQTYQAASQLIASHNDKGYGTIRGEDGGEFGFSHLAVAGRRGFDDLRRGQLVEYTVAPESRSSASAVHATSDQSIRQFPVDNADEESPRFRYVTRTFRRPLQRSISSDHPLDGYPG
jgi:cold shock CspA family protein